MLPRRIRSRGFPDAGLGLAVPGRAGKTFFHLMVEPNAHVLQILLGPHPLWRTDKTITLNDLPAPLFEHTVGRFGQDLGSGPVRDVIRGEEQKFAELVSRGRQVLARFGPGPGRPLAEADLRYLHETHGLPPELVTELLT